MEIIKLKIDEVIPYENNPRNNDEAVAYVAESIKQCGYCSPIIIDEDNGILCGHTRLKALKQLGCKEVECVRKSGMTDEQKKKYRILDNKTAEVAEWNFDLLEAELKDLDFGDFDFGFDDMPELSEPAEITEDEVPEVDDKSEPITKPGDIWQLGKHRLMCGDSTDASAVAALMNGKEADLLLTDPPYNVAYVGGTDVDTGATNRKLGSDMAQSVTGGGLHGKDLSKADVSVNIYAFQKAQKTGKPVELCCAIGDNTVDGKPYSEIVEEAREYIKSVGGFEKFAEWGLF